MTQLPQQIGPSASNELRASNHYVPRVYLKQWATDGRIPTCSLLVPHKRVPLWKRHSLRGIAFHQHLYTQIIGGEESDELERWLDAEFEAPAKAPIERVVSEQALSVDDWHALIRFAFAQDVRTPARLREFLRRQSQDLPAQLEAIVNQAVKRLESAGPAVVPNATRSKDFPLKVSLQDQGDGSGTLKAETVVGRKLWHWSLRHLLLNTIDKIPLKGWSILRPALGLTWPTSDNPLIRLNYESPARYDFNGGWAVHSGDILLPLSPTHLLHRCAGHKGKQRGFRLDTATTQRTIQIIIEHADRYIFAANEFDVDRIRERRVSAQDHAEERAMWSRWPSEQAAIEGDLEKPTEKRVTGQSSPL